VKNDERQYVLSLLQAGQSTEYAAEALVLRRAVAEVEEVAAYAVRLDRAQEANALRMSLYYYTLYAPQEKAVKVRDGARLGDGTVEAELWQRPGRQAYKVLVSDFPAFCKERRLNLDAMTELVKGKRWDVNGWQCVWSGDQLDRGQQGDPPMRASQEDSVASLTRRRAEDAVRPPRKAESAYSPPPPAIAWTPRA
jgi:hypothetical protein